MIVNKKAIGKLNKCYALAQLYFDGREYIAVAAEKTDPAYLFDWEGNFIEQLWDGPGGVMSMEQYQGTYPTLLATRKFYSPNDSADASIVYYQRKEDGWHCNTLCRLPFVHRFGILKSDAGNFLVACTIKSAHAFKDDWTCPGRVWGAQLPDDISVYNEFNQLEMVPVLSGLYHNHGFCKENDGGKEVAIVGSDNGVFEIIPPSFENTEWTCRQLLTEPTSDMLWSDFDDDGKRELLCLSPFHGDTVTIYHESKEGYEPVYLHENKLPFLHAIYHGVVNGKETAFVGCRQGNRELLMLQYDDDRRQYVSCMLDSGAGAANCLYYEKDGRKVLVAANRETDEIAMYELEGE